MLEAATTAWRTRKAMMEPGFAASALDTSKPHPARMYDAYLGGKDNYPADRQAVREILRAWPEVKDIARANRAFMQRAVRFLAGHAGIRQFLDIGTGIPTAGNVHEIAGPIATGTRVVYVDNDPIVHVHANALLTGNGTTSVVLADLREPEAILTHSEVRELIDFSQPVALLLIASMHFIPAADDPAGIVATLRDALAPGSYMALSHGTADFHPPGIAERAASAYKNATAPLALRSREEISALFDGFELVQPGLVQAPLWRPDRTPPRPKELVKLGIYAGVGSKL